jgi:hypothetical protein
MVELTDQPFGVVVNPEGHVLHKTRLKKGFVPVAKVPGRNNTGAVGKYGFLRLGNQTNTEK